MVGVAHGALETYAWLVKCVVDHGNWTEPPSEEGQRRLSSKDKTWLEPSAQTSDQQQ